MNKTFMAFSLMLALFVVTGCQKKSGKPGEKKKTTKVVHKNHNKKPGKKK